MIRTKNQMWWTVQLTILTFSGIPWNVEGGDESELFLTPMIRKGELDKAKAAAIDNIKTAHIKTVSPVKSYSGYLTIDEKAKSNLFFYFFPAAMKPESAPLVLWINDLPGFSCLRSVFAETGPFYIDENNELKDRPTAWTKTHSVLYLDAPVGAGFSFTENSDGYATSSMDEASEVYEALVQFFKLFPEFLGRDFYMAGENYAGTFVPFIALKIDEQNSKGGLKINLKGAMIGSPMVDIQTQIIHSDFWHEAGLINEEQLKIVQAEETKILNFAKAKKFDEALTTAVNLIIAPNSYFHQFTGFQNPRNVLFDKDPVELARYIKFVDTKEMHNYLHVGLHKFEFASPKAFHHMVKDYFSANPKKLEAILDKGFKVLLFASQFDAWITPTGVTKMVKGLKWKGAADFAKAERKVWKVGEEVAGFAESSKNLDFVYLRSAGGFAMMDQPVWTLDMLQRFTSGKGF